MKTGVKAGSVVIVEDITLLSVRTCIGIVRWTKFDEIRSLVQSGLVNIVVIERLRSRRRVPEPRTIDIQLTLHFSSGTSLPSSKD